MGYLQKLDFIMHRRGLVRLLNREALEEAACVCYQGFERDARWHEGAELSAGGFARSHV